MRISSKKAYYCYGFDSSKQFCVSTRIPVTGLHSLRDVLSRLSGFYLGLLPTYVVNCIHDNVRRLYRVYGSTLRSSRIVKLKCNFHVD